MVKLLLEILVHLSKEVIDLLFDLFVRKSKKEILEDDKDTLAEYKKRFGKKVLGVFLSIFIIGGGVALHSIQVNEKTKKNKEHASVYNTEINFNHLENVNSNYFNFIRIENNTELVQGFTGSYYYVDFILDIEGASKKEVFFFEKGKYFIESKNRRKKFEVAVNKFINAILNSTKKESNDYKIFVRGKADILPIKRMKGLDSRYQFTKIDYIQRLSDTKYNPNKVLTHYIFDNSIRNEDLPFLRAQYIKNYFNKIKSTVKTPILLEGSVSGNVSEYDRNVEIIFFSPETNI